MNNVDSQFVENEIIANETAAANAPASLAIAQAAFAAAVTSGEVAWCPACSTQWLLPTTPTCPSCSYGAPRIVDSYTQFGLLLVPIASIATT